MRASKRFALIGLAVLSVYLLTTMGVYDRFINMVSVDDKEGRMKNVVVVSSSYEDQSPVPEAAEQTPEALPTMADDSSMEAHTEPLSAVMEAVSDDEIKETTIRGGLTIKNETCYEIDVPQLLRDGPGLSLTADGPQILIIHTHASEAYTQAGLDRYEAQDNTRTADTEFNIVRVGEELTKIFEEAGLKVIHDKGIYDFPSYIGSYTRSGAAVEEYLREYPSIVMVIDMHRDAIGANGVVYKTMAEEDGVCASQIMLLVGTDDSGLEHPAWKSNLAMALYLQAAVDQKNPTLMRPVSLVKERYNQQLTAGSIIIEVGSNGNTLQEALAAIRLFGRVTAPALLQLVEPNAEGE